MRNTNNSKIQNVTGLAGVNKHNNHTTRKATSCQHISSRTKHAENINTVAFGHKSININKER